jgi:hypothetical protein
VLNSARRKDGILDAPPSDGFRLFLQEGRVSRMTVQADVHRTTREAVKSLSGV